MLDGKILEWSHKRIKGIVEFYGHQFMSFKKILDLGCGYGDLSGVLYRLGADITAVDACQEYMKVAARKYPGIKTVKVDLNNEWPFYGKSFDIILDLDLLGYLNDYEKHLRAVCASTKNLVLETAVCDSDDQFKNITVTENRKFYDMCANGTCQRPSAAAIERVLKECGMSFKRQDHVKYNSGSYKYDWLPINNDSTDYYKRRIWFCSKDISAHKPSSLVSTINVARPPTIGYVPSLQNTGVPLLQERLLDPPIIGAPKPLEVFDATKLKIALCISGHLRTFENNFESVKRHILNNTNCDVFIHTWNTLGLANRPGDSGQHAIDTNILANKIKQLYNPKELIIEPLKQMQITPLMQARQLDRRDILGILSMFYKIEACNELKKQYELKNNFTYDCVIRFRGDLFMEKPLPFNNESSFDNLFIPTYGNFGGTCDQIAYGNSKIMDIYSSLYSNIPSYMEMGGPMHPERLLKFHIEQTKLPMSKVEMKFLIKRRGGAVQNNMILERALGFIK